MEKEKEKDNFKSWVAVMVAVVTVFGAMAACMASGAVSSAGDADFEGLDAAIRGQKAEIINYINAYEHYRAFTVYVRYNELGNLMYDPEIDPNSDESFKNGAIQREVWGLASGISAVFFSPRYLTSDGKYDLERELQEALAQDAQNDDIDPNPYFESSDKFRKRSSFLTADMIVFAFSFWFLTLAQTTEKNIKLLWAGLGILIGLAGIAGIIIGRFMI
ncbi:MAG TPA: hypothetical protein PK414_06600 [Anaerolineales bacterium]|nr:hypothetical protein [Anaerolineales bacterium]